MAASSTDTYDTNNSQLNKDSALFNNASYPVCSVSTDQNNFWTADVSSDSTSPSSEHNWEADEEEAIKRAIYELKRQFHNGRFLILRNLPKDITEEEIREILRDQFVHSVQIQQAANTAKVLLAEPEVLDNWTQTKHTHRGKEIHIQPASTEDLLCVARLPQDVKEDEFAALAAKYGRVNFSFLMRSEKSGESKAYGFINYSNKDVAMQAKTSLHGKELHQKTLVCEWLCSTHTTIASLHSTCLYVDGLPKDYRDMGEFREIFSKYGTPIYCRIAMNQGVVQDWGLVEFKTAREVEDTRNHLNNHVIKGCPIRVDYWIPGVRAVTIYMKLLNEKNTMKKQALLPEPPTDKVFNQLQNLAKHNPNFAKSLQNIIQTQIQNVQQNGSPPPSVTGPSVVCPDIPTPPLTHMMGIQRALLGNTPQGVNPMAHLIPVPLTAGAEEPLNRNAQAALLIILAAQLQNQKGAANLLTNPQVLAILQSLVSQGDPNQACSPPPVLPNTNGSLSSNLKANFRNGYFKNGPSARPFKGPLLPTPESSSHSARSSPENVALNICDLDSNIGSMLDSILNPTKESASVADVGSLSTLLTNAQDLNQILRSLKSESLMGATPPISSMGALSSVQNSVITSLASHHPPPLLHTPPNMFEPQEPLMLMRPEDSARPESFLASINPMQHAPSPFLFPAPVPGRGPSPLAGPWPAGSLFPAPVFSAPPHLRPGLFNSLYLPPHSVCPSIMSTHVGSMPPPMSGYSTPGRKKRKSSHFLPSPESSPENGYVGQHSQGIGGHYPESYKKTKLDS